MFNLEIPVYKLFGILTVPRSIGWGLLVTLPMIMIIYCFYPDHYLLYDIILDGILVGPSHMLLDVFTEREFMLRGMRSGKDLL
ncbi:hypothetical protein YN1551_3281 [Sulfolobus islandicus Y.N.15.51]|uniref:Uncharacterized protein n=1 Tax=Saccharolobus islandicus (strain Y.N.15.51 / Yellowstone \|nr:hypothetical protein YN1551_3281 [Sulfolobus islandicus Y.N.15.51]